jgi:ethanolamine transporter EutH
VSSDLPPNPDASSWLALSILFGFINMPYGVVTIWLVWQWLLVPMGLPEMHWTVALVLRFALHALSLQGVAVREREKLLAYHKFMDAASFTLALTLTLGMAWVAAGQP